MLTFIHVAVTDTVHLSALPFEPRMSDMMTNMPTTINIMKNRKTPIFIRSFFVASEPLWYAKTPPMAARLQRVITRNGILSFFRFIASEIIARTPNTVNKCMKSNIVLYSPPAVFDDLIIKKIVIDEESVSVKEFESNDDTILIEVMVPNDEMPRVIGKNGNVINSIRTIVQASAHLDDNKRVNINVSSY